MSDSHEQSCVRHVPVLLPFVDANALRQMLDTIGLPADTLTAAAAKCRSAACRRSVSNSET
eukprot:5805597-Pleurochrysis_carterae.AAC.5